MIQANELKTGNIILLDGKDRGIVKAIDERDYTVVVENPFNTSIDGLSGDTFSLWSDFVTGIPITPAILEVCGFTDCKHGVALQLNEPYQELMYIFNHLPICLDVDNGRMPCFHIKHLHQLQNLFFALTGTELTINLEKVKV